MKLCILASVVCILTAFGSAQLEPGFDPKGVVRQARTSRDLSGLSPDNSDRAPQFSRLQAPSESFQEDAVMWRTRSVYPGRVTYRGMTGAWEREADTSFLYAVGGQTIDSGYTSECYRYSSRTNIWTRLADMPVASSNQCTVYWADNGGGTDSSGCFTFGTARDTSTTDCYWWRKSTNVWSLVVSYQGPTHIGNMAAVVGDSVFLMTYDSTFRFQRYSIRQGTWARRADPPVENYFGAMCVSQGKVYQCGGWFNQLTFQEYDPVTGTWQSKAPCPSVVGGNSPCLAPWDTGPFHRIYCWGGGDGWMSKSGVAWWDPGTNVWTVEGNLPEGVIGAFYAPVQEFPGPINGLNHVCGYTGSELITTHRRGVPDVPPYGVDQGKAPLLSRSGIRVLSNPSRYGIAFYTDACADISVCDAAGRVVKSRTAAEGSNWVDLFKPGVYLVKVKTDGLGTAQKVVVER